MYPALVTSSAVDAFLACTGTVLLPRVRRDTVGAAAGTEEHADKLRPGGLPPKVLAWFGGHEPAYEVAMAADAVPVEGKSSSLALGRYLDRGYPSFPTATWVAGTADMIRVDDGIVSVADLKTGRGQSKGSLPPPADSGQLLSLAWMTCLLVRERRPAWRPTRIRLCWWYTAERPDDLEDAEITPEQLGAWTARLGARVKEARAFGALQLARGPQCHSCAAFDACPAQGGAVRRVAELSGALPPDGELDDAFLAAAWHDVVAADRIVESARAALEARVAARGPFALGPDHEVRLVRQSGSRIDPAVAEQVLGARFAECAKVEVSQASMRRGLGVADVAGVVEEIAARGGVTKYQTAPYLRATRRGRESPK